jgi:hypothetical protein
VLIFILAINNSFSEVRYVSKTGSSTPPYTSWEHASDSLQKCINICNAGDTIYVANGIYKESLLINTFVSLIGSSMDSTVIDGRGLDLYTVKFIIGGNITKFSIYGVGMERGGSAALKTYGLLDARFCRITESQTAVSIVDGPSVIENCIISKTKYGYITTADINFVNYFRNNIVTFKNTQSGKAMDLGGGTTYIQNNILIDTSGYWNLNLGIYLTWVYRVVISNNLISGFRTNIDNRLVTDTIMIYNNTILYKNENDAGTFYGSVDVWPAKAVIINNIIANSFSNAGIRGEAGKTISDYNLFWRNYKSIHGFPMGENDIIADPMFVNDKRPGVYNDYDFHLQKYSPAIDRGDPSILDRDGSRSDIGWLGGPGGTEYTYLDLAPRAPVNLTATVDSMQVKLTWNKNTEADTAYYNVYFDTTANFIIDTTKLISRQKDTTYKFTKPIIGRYYVKITAEDTQGNKSLPSKEIIIIITGTEKEPELITDYQLYQNYPNPFNPKTIISYRIKEPGYVKLQVYNINGEEVKTLVNKEQPAGYYEAEFNAEQLSSGIYLYKLEVTGKGNIPSYTEMRKSILIK